jgi:hypothetical protein
MSDLISTGNPQADAIANIAIPVALAVATTTSPQAAAAVAAINAIMPVMQAALKANTAGQISDQAVMDMWAATTQTITTTHNAWAAMNAAMNAADAADAAK